MADDRVSVETVAANAYGAVPVDSGKTQSDSGQVASVGGVPYEDWGSTQYKPEDGIPKELEVQPTEFVDEALVASLVGVDVQVHGLDNRPQAVVPDAGLVEEQTAAAEAVSQETPEPEPEVEPEVQVEEAVDEPKRGPGRPRKEK